MDCFKCKKSFSRLKSTSFGDVCQPCYDRFYWCVEDRRKIRELEEENARYKKLYDVGKMVNYLAPKTVYAFIEANREFENE